MRAVVQIRGNANMQSGIRDTLAMLNLHHVNHCAFVPDDASHRGMVDKVNDYVAHGEPSVEVIETLLRQRAEPADGDADIDDTWVAEHTDHGDVAALAAALHGEETTLAEQGLSPVLRLHPPRGGHGGIKQPAADGGQIGKHTTEDIDQLLEAMR